MGQSSNKTSESTLVGCAVLVALSCLLDCSDLMEVNATLLKFSESSIDRLKSVQQIQRRA